MPSSLKICIGQRKSHLESTVCICEADYPHRLAMLTCHGCMRLCFQAITGSTVSITSRTGFTLASSISTHQSQSFTTVTRAYKTLEPWQVKAAKRAGNRKKVRSTKKSREAAEREASLHLKFLKDPVKLAQFVRETLREDKYELAQSIVNEASSRMASVVSWNHIIEWYLSKGKMNAALKCYNDVGWTP